MFELLKDELLLRHDGRPPHASILGAGMLSSSVAQCVSYPLALVRTRLQVSGWSWMRVQSIVVCACVCAQELWCPTPSSYPPRLQHNNPTHTLKTQLKTHKNTNTKQAQGVSGMPVKYGGMVDVLSTTLKKEGFVGLYKGLLPNLIKLAPAAGISWYVFEATKRALGVDPRS